MESTAHLIFLRSNSLLLSKKPYSNWRQIQDEFDDYMASLGPYTEAELLEYFLIDYGEDDARWPCTKAAIAQFFKSDAVMLECK